MDAYRISRAALPLALMVAMAAAGCERDQADAPQDEGGERAKEEAAPTSWRSDRPEPSRQVLATLQEVATSCELGERGEPVRCSGKEAGASKAALEALGPEALGSLAVVLSSAKQEPSEPVAAWVLAEVLEVADFAEGSREREQLDEAAVARLIEVLGRAEPSLAARIAPTVAHAAGATGQTEELMEALAAHPHPEVRAAAYEHVMTLGRMKAFGHLDGPRADAAEDRLVRVAALKAPLHMKGWARGEREELCEVYKDLLSSQREPLDKWPARVVARCGDLDALSEALEQRVEDGQLSATFTEALLEACSTEQGEGRLDRASCGELAVLLEDAVGRQELEARSRAAALHALIHIRPDSSTRDLAARLLKGEPRAPEAVRAVIERDMAAIERAREDR